MFTSEITIHFIKSDTRKFIKLCSGKWVDMAFGGSNLGQLEMAGWLGQPKPEERETFGPGKARREGVEEVGRHQDSSTEGTEKWLPLSLFLGCLE